MENHFAHGGITEKIIVLSRIIEHIANHNVLEKLDISLAGYEILHILHYHNETEPSVLAKFLGSGKSNVTQRVNILLKNGLVTKVKSKNSDGRKSPIKLTAKGEKLFAIANEQLNKETNDLEKMIGEDEVKNHSPFLEKIFNALLAGHKECCPKKILSTMKNKIILPLLLSSLALSLTGCGKQAEVKAVKEPISVKAQTAEASRQIDERVEYAAMVYPEEEALVIAKAGGTATAVKFKLGDKVKAGDVLIKIDDASGKNPSGNYAFNASQVKQAQLAVAQAYSSVLMARTNYQNLLYSSPKDLEQARITKDQATKGIATTDSISAENYRSAEIAYDTAKLATEQARINLESRKKQVGLSTGDTGTNSAAAADTAANTCDSIINSLDNYLGLDDANSNYLSCASDLGVLDSAVMRQTKEAYRLAKTANDTYKLGGFADTAAQVKLSINLAGETKNLTDLAKRVLDKTTVSTNLPQSSLSGTSLSSLISMVGGYQSHANGALAQANGAKQLLENTDLGNDSNLSLLEKGYELAQKQEEAALQALNALNAGQSGQKDQAGFGAQSATTQYEGLKIKLDSQLAVAKSQLDMAQLQYSTAGVALQGLYDSHLAISPISGIVTQKQIDNGSTISPGQILASVSRTDQVKIQFFADENSLKYLAPGQAVEILGNDGQSTPGKIFNLTPQADQVSKKFLVEVKPDSATSTQLTAGTVVNVAVSLKKTATAKNAVLLPLSAIEISQNNNFIFTINNGVASKTPIQIIKVDGETAQIKFEGDDKTLIIVEGNKLVSEGDPVKTE